MVPLVLANRVRHAIAAATYLILAAGCSRLALPPAPSAMPGTRPVAARFVVPNPVQQTPQYREAVRLYAKHDRTGALAALDSIRPEPGWTAEDREYLQRQKRIVERREARGGSGTRVDAPRPPIPGEKPSAERADCGPRALLIVCEKLGGRADLAELRRLAGTTGIGTTMEGLAKAARAKGLAAEGVQMNRAALSALDRPAIAWVGGDHYVAVLGVRDGSAEVRDPNGAGATRMPVEELLRKSGGVMLRVEGRKSKVEGSE